MSVIEVVVGFASNACGDSVVVPDHLDVESWVTYTMLRLCADGVEVQALKAGHFVLFTGWYYAPIVMARGVS